MKANRLVAACVGAALLASSVTLPARAENQMGYRLVTMSEAQSLPRNGGALGMDVERLRQITDDGMTFEIIRIKSVRRGSAGAQAGLAVGDQIIAVNGQLFQSIAAFAGYVGSLPPGSQASIDYIPNRGGPGDAQRVTLVVGGAKGVPPANAAESHGMSTKTKIGIAAAALIGCYALGCFSSSKHQPAPAR